ncbi:hypothetical protein ABZ916_39330 [Streptomyces sp. NPDC046853]|uniref:hypothetical protein n=1 Tax=Streptomyces sp. NPDC046853 TaxID=3154920 RepID=UPI0033ED8366
MTSTDDILAQIDHALYDVTVGPDAMRSRPAPDAGPQVWIAPAGTDPADEGWEPIGHLVDIEEQVTIVEIAPDLERLTRAFQAVQQMLRRVTWTTNAGEWVDTNGDPVEPPVRPRPALPRRDGRPAWQSPHGPAHRRR